MSSIGPIGGPGSGGLSGDPRFFRNPQHPPKSPEPAPDTKNPVSTEEERRQAREKLLETLRLRSEEAKNRGGIDETI